MELHVPESLTGPGEGQLALRGSVGVVEGRLGRASLGDQAQVVDGEGPLQPSLAAVELRLLELHQLEEFGGVGELALHHDVPLRSGGESHG